MASGGSSDRTSSNQRSFGFGSDDVLCAYDEYTNQDQSNGRRSDLSSIKEYNESRTGRQLASSYGHQDEYPKEDIVNVVEKSMKKYADNLMRHLEGISGRLSQLEVHCYKLDRSIGEFHSDMIRDQSETDTKLKSLEKHLQEVHRSIQILRDKQELAETQKELTKLQLSPPKDTSVDSQSKKSQDSNPPSVSEHNHDIPNPHLALALTHQTSVPTLPAPQGPQAPQAHDHYALNQPAQYYPHQTQTQTQPGQPEPSQYTQPRPPFQHTNQTQQPPIQPPPPPQSTHSYPSYQQQYPQQTVAPPQPPTPLPQQPVRPHASFGYYQIPNQQQQQQQQQSSFGAPPTVKPSGYESGPPYPPHSSSFQAYGYADGSRAQPYGPPSSYPQALSNSGGGYHQQMTRTHPYADMIEKAVNMGYPSGQVVSLVNMMADSGQPVDFNALLDRLNSSGGAARAWSG